MGAYKFYKSYYGRRKYERWPRHGESVLDRQRDDRGPFGHGTIVHVDKDNKRVMVSFRSPLPSSKGTFVLAYLRRDNKSSDHLWNANDAYTWDFSTPHYIDLDAQFEEAHCDELITYQHYEFDDLSKSSTGWITRGSYP